MCQINLLSLKYFMGFESILKWSTTLWSWEIWLSTIYGVYKPVSSTFSRIEDYNQLKLKQFEKFSIPRELSLLGIIMYCSPLILLSSVYRSSVNHHHHHYLILFSGVIYFR